MIADGVDEGRASQEAGTGADAPHETTFRSPRDVRPAAEGPGPRRARALGTDADDLAPTTSDTLAVHRAARRRAANDAEAGSSAAPPSSEPAAAEVPGEAGGRRARVPASSSVVPVGVRPAAPVMADRAVSAPREPQGLFDGRQAERGMRASARRQVLLLAAAAAAVSAVGAVALVGLLTAGAP